LRGHCDDLRAHAATAREQVGVGPKVAEDGASHGAESGEADVNSAHNASIWPKARRLGKLPALMNQTLVVGLAAPLKGRLLAGALLLLAVGLTSCEFSRPPAPAGSHLPPRGILKFVPYASDGRLVAYFTLADASTNQVASDGDLRIQIYTTTSLSLGGGPPSGGGMVLRRPLYDNTFAVGVTNFRWETYGNFFTVKDLAFRFMVPYEAMKGPVRKGRVATVEIMFHPDGATNTLVARRNVAFY